MLSDFGLGLDEAVLVSCVLVTTGRVDLIGAAIDCFVAQTYKNRELIVVSQGNAEENAAIRAMLNHPNMYFLDVPKRLTLGQMRNLSIEMAHGDVICQWDDDDFYHPNRITSQYKFLRNDTVASLYFKYFKYFADTRKLYLIDQSSGTEDYMNVLEKNPHKRFLCGSVMFKKSCFHNSNNLLYPEHGEQSDKEEDLNVLMKLMKLGAVVSVPSCDYCYVYHGGNVYQRRHHEMLFHKKHIASELDLLIHKSNIELILKTAHINTDVDVCTTALLDFDLPNTCIEENVVFTYTPSCKI